MWADMMTKEMELLSALEDVFQKNDLVFRIQLVNEVKAIGTEIRMNNIRNT